jgi:hypothetical protein
MRRGADGCPLRGAYVSRVLNRSEWSDLIPEISSMSTHNMLSLADAFAAFEKDATDQTANEIRDAFRAMGEASGNEANRQESAKRLAAGGDKLAVVRASITAYRTFSDHGVDIDEDMLLSSLCAADFKPDAADVAGQMFKAKLAGTIKAISGLSLDAAVAGWTAQRDREHPETEWNDDNTVRVGGLSRILSILDNKDERKALDADTLKAYSNQRQSRDNARSQLKAMICLSPVVNYMQDCMLQTGSVYTGAEGVKALTPQLRARIAERVAEGKVYTVAEAEATIKSLCAKKPGKSDREKIDALAKSIAGNMTALFGMVEALAKLDDASVAANPHDVKRADDLARAAAALGFTTDGGFPWTEIMTDGTVNHPKIVVADNPEIKAMPDVDPLALTGDEPAPEAPAPEAEPVKHLRKSKRQVNV